MIELGELEKHYRDFEQRHAKVVVVSIEDLDQAKLTQEQFPHLVVAADTEKHLATALKAIQNGPSTQGKDANAPTTLVVDGSGTIREVFRVTRHVARPSPETVLATLDHVER